MKKPVSYVLLAAAFVVAALIGATTGASADQRTVTVELADGSTTTVTVDVPPGTPLQDVQLPPPPPLPTVPLPTTPTPSPSPSPSPGDQSQNPSDQGNQDNGPNGKKGETQKKTGDKSKAAANAL